jgi:hypothetical protein
MYKNILFSSDQDIILFSLYNIKNNNFVYIKKEFNIHSNNIILYEHNNLNINLCILTLFFNESDYFKGIYNFKITDIKLIKLYKKHPIAIKLLQEQYISVKSLVATFLQFFTTITDINFDEKYIDLYFNEIEKYIKISEDFYITNINMLENIITLPQLMYYMCKQKVIYKTYVNNQCIESIFKL